MDVSQTGVVFGDILDAQLNRRLPYRALKRVMRLLRDKHPQYPRARRQAGRNAETCNDFQDFTPNATGIDELVSQHPCSLPHSRSSRILKRRSRLGLNSRRFDECSHS